MMMDFVWTSFELDLRSRPGCRAVVLPRTDDETELGVRDKLAAKEKMG